MMSLIYIIPFKQDVKNGKRTYFLAKPKPENYTRTKLSVDFEKNMNLISHIQFPQNNKIQNISMVM